MIVKARAPVVYTSTSNDWSAASIILAGAVLALLGFLIFYFSIMHASEIARVPAGAPQTVIEHDLTPAPVPVPNPVPEAQPVLQPAPVPVEIARPGAPSRLGDAQAKANRYDAEPQ